MIDYSETVEKILRAQPITRDDDWKLFAWACKLICPDVLKVSFDRAVWYHNEYKLPSFETIRRTRQKLQHDHPELRGKLYLKRMEKQDEYKQNYGRKC